MSGRAILKMTACGMTAAARNFYDNMVKTLTEQHPRTKPETLQARALEQTAKYAERLHRQRALTIAQTEMAYAYNYGADEGIRQAQADYLIGKCIKKWCTSGDEGVCEECEKLDGMEIGMEEQFFSGNKVEYDESGLFPPLHPRCGCAVEYIEVEAPNFSLQNPLPNVSMDQGISSMNELTRNADGTYTITEEPITDISIERVSKLAPTGWSDEMATRLQDANRKLLADARQYPTGTETATVYSMDFSVCSQTVVGTYGAVNIPVLDEPYIGIHNHPDGLVFSPADIINFFSRNSMNALVAVGNNGSAYLMQKMSEYDAVKAFDAFGLVKQDMDKAVAAGDPQALVNVIENFLREAKKYGVEFISGS